MDVLQERATIYAEEIAALRRDMDEANERWAELCRGTHAESAHARAGRNRAAASVPRLLVA